MTQPAINLGELLNSALPVSLRHVPLRIRDVAHSLHVRAALSGGVPRDLLRLNLSQIDRHAFQAELRDFDVVVEAEAKLFAYELARRLPGELTLNEAFHTAALLTGDPLRIDITSARREEYPRPGQLPVVDISAVSIEEDMLRRDFTVNALAFDLSDDYGRLLDPVGGAGDVAERLIRILHGASFSDDPTRLLRALRYSLRLNYDMEPTTLAAFQRAVDDAVADNLTPERIRYELECIGGEPRWAEIWAVMDLSGLARALSLPLGGVSAEWRLEDAAAVDIGLSSQRELMARAELPAWLVRTAWALAAAPEIFAAAIAERLGLFATHQHWLAEARRIIRQAVPLLSVEPRPSAITRALERHPRQAVALALLVYQPRTEEGVEARKKLLRYLEEYSGVRGTLSGHDLMALGLASGPRLGALRDQLRYLWLDGVIRNAAEEREYAVELIARETDKHGI